MHLEARSILLNNEKAQFRSTLIRYSGTHALYSIEVFLMFKLVS